MFSLNNSDEPMKFFRIYFWYIYSNVYNWKSLAYSIYHIEHLINHFDNYQIKTFLEKQFRNLSDYFTLFMKDLITIEIQSSKRNNTNSDINQIEQHIENLKTHCINLKESILIMKERFNLCKTDIDAIEILLQAIEDINFDWKIFDKSDREKIRFLSLKEDLAQKSTRTDLIQMKIYIDNQIKNLIELNKENARELERIKLLKTSSCQARHIQSILSTNPSSHSKQFYSHQSSRPYITFELDHIRKYQRQALMKSPYGTIPLYRRQAWAAANLFPNHSLHFLRYMQNSLRMQIHDLIGYDPSDICNTNKKKKLKKNSTMEVLHRDKDVLIMGNNKKLYRGRIDSCEVMPLKKGEEKKLKTKTNIEEKNDVHFDQFDQSNERIFDEHLFEYLDWQIQFNEQDLPNELCEELFDHWTSIICNDQPCSCNSESKSFSIDIPSKSSSTDTIYDDRCMCSKCSCSCEKYSDDQSICLCSQCSCKCLKDFSSEDQPEVSHEIVESEINTKEEEEQTEILPTDQIAIVQENEVKICDCFLNRWPEQFPLSHENLSQSSKKPDIKTIFNSLELDDPTLFRQQILKHNSI